MCARKLSVRKISARRKCARNPRTFTLFTCCVQAAAAEEGRVARKNIFFVKICIIVHIRYVVLLYCSSSILFQSCLEKF